MKRSLVVLFLGVAWSGALATAALATPRSEATQGEFQYAFAFDNRGVDGRPAHPVTAYLWIPASAEQLRAVIVTQQNVGEQPFVEHPAIREVCAKNGIAIVWCCAPIDLRFERAREEAVGLLEAALRELGARSGFPELGTVPWITFGHSTTTTFARSVAEARPERTIAILSAKGGIMLPVTGSIPGVYSGGQFPEWRQPTHDWKKHGMSLPGLAKIREELAQRWRPVSYVEEYGGGHFDYPDRYLAFLALYIDKAMHYRLAANGGVRAISDREGWVVDVRPPLPTAPLAVAALDGAAGPLRNAPWFFDRELADAAVALMDNGRWDRENQIVAFANFDGTPAAFSRSGIVDPVPCEFAADGITINRIVTTFIEQLPSTFTQAGMRFGHAAGGARTIERISGVFAVHQGVYAIELNRGYPEVPNFIAVRHPGDARFRPSVQPGRFVPPTYTGRAQRIDFPVIEDQHLGAAAVRLRATSSAGLKVRYFVRNGPAKIVGDELVLLPLPRRAKLPVPVTVAAWQIGTAAEGGVAPAVTVEQTFRLLP